MSRITIVREDNVVIVDGRKVTFDLSGMVPDTVWAVQLFDGQGEVEQTDGINRDISDTSEFDAVIAEANRLIAEEDAVPPDPNEAEYRLLATLDMQSIRDIREWVAAQPDAPQTLKDREAQAVAARARLQ